MEQPRAARVDRRALLTGGAAVAAAAALGVADDGVADDDGSLVLPAGDDPAGVVVGTVTGHPSPGAIDVRELESARVVRVTPAAGAGVVGSDGSEQPLEQFAVGDEVLAVANADADGSGVLLAQRVTPCVVGQRSDVDR